VLSLPVFDGNEVQVGFIDIIDVMHFLLKVPCYSRPFFLKLRPK